MRRHLLAGVALLALLSPASAANTTVTAMSAASALGGTELFYVVQGGADRKATPAQIDTYVRSLMGTGVSGALNINTGSAGSIVLFNGALGTPTSGVATNLTGTASGLTAGNVTTNANLTGMVTSVGNAASLGSFTSANLATALTNETGSGAAVFGTAPTITSPTVGTAATFSFITGSTQCLQVDSSGVLSGAGASCGTSSSTAVPSDQTGTNYAFQGTDLTKIIYLSNGSNQVPTIAQAGTGSFTSGWYTTACNTGAGTQTITPATSTIGGAATFVLPAGSAARPLCAAIISDGTNYRVVPDFGMDASSFSAGTIAAARGGAGTINGALKGNGSGVVSQAACTDLSDDGALCSATPGTGVATAIAANLSAAGGLTTTVASGTSALGTSAITSATCATAVTTTATNTATTDVIQWGFNGDPTAVTGYVPLVAGMLTIIAYPSANNVNFKVCNNTSGSVTPGAITLNWRVLR